MASRRSTVRRREGLRVPIPGRPGRGKNFCHARPAAAHFSFEMTICAWCEHTIEAGPPAAAPRVSHGICPSCLDLQLATVGRAPRRTTARRAPSRERAVGPLRSALPASPVLSAAPA